MAKNPSKCLNEHCPVIEWVSPRLLLAANHRSHSPRQTPTRRPVDSFSSQMIQAPSQCTREEDGEFFPAPLPPSAPPPPFMHMFVQFEMAFRYCYGSRFVCALLVVRAPAAVISNGNYTRHFRRNWDLFRSLGTLRGAVTRCNGYLLRRPTRVTRRTASNAYTSRRLRESPEHCEQVP